MHVIAAKAQCFYEALQPEFKIYQSQVLANIKFMCKSLQEEDFRIVSGGTDNHLILVDVKSSVGMTGKEAESILDSILITCNKNTIPNETESPFITSGIRLGSPAMTTRGLNEEDFYKIGKIISKALKKEEELDVLKQQVLEITSKYPIYK